jgi:3-isopropylmalate/(R)-2-methylmalate dehydratase small subunit
MEVAVTALVAAGIHAVLARSFSRTYFRNAVNNGLLPVVCDTRGIREGDRVRVEVGAVHNETTNEIVAFEPLPAVMMEIIGAGGLVGYMVRRRRA